ncbi:hypothetical protein IV203_038765 [Nitzschia inconspicua]|uniref:GAT domain-containing protein n=1 Tax=Nitzschia inconspicua TaxID=303405 RepID=A0A9K3PZR9_9STRA|nr:hypothetical protein IV203_038765 [Nitzschia inconspicua]
MAEPATSSSPSAQSSMDANNKIMKDLRSVNEKIDLLNQMLNPGAGTPKMSITNDAVMAVVGFLEACKPRMIELIEAASMIGVLSETVFEAVLQCNDRLQKALEDVETAALTETTAETTAATAASENNNDDDDDVTDQFNDLLLGDLDDPPPSAPVVAGPKSTGEEDSTNDMKQPATVPASSSNDEFDSFFAERQGP